jgi:phosphoenolpyruvate carboxylase
MSADELLRREIDQLGRLFGDVIVRFDGEQAFNLIEKVRHEARLTASGDAAAGERLAAQLKTLSLGELRTVVRAFSMFLELANLAEDRQRVRTLRARERESYPHPHRESIGDAIERLRERGMTSEETRALLNRIHAELVFTAHPTEAKRRSVRSKVSLLRSVLASLDSNQLLPSEEEALRTRLRGALTMLWQTDPIPPNRPTVETEIHRGLSFRSTLWSTVPRIYATLRASLATAYPDESLALPKLLSFGTWIGGDRDGHPFVTPTVTAQSLHWLWKATLEAHLTACYELVDSLSISRQKSRRSLALEERIHAACNRWPELMPKMALEGIHETYRRWLHIIHWRLGRTAEVQMVGPRPTGCYSSVEELLDDVGAIQSSLLAEGNTEVAGQEVQTWIDQIQVFGFHTARLDIRQHSAVYRDVIAELWQAAGLIDSGVSLTEADRIRLLAVPIKGLDYGDPTRLSQTTGETLKLYRTMRRAARALGMDALGGNVISMTRYPSDLLNVLWLWQWSERTDGGKPCDAELRLPIVPLFETIADLRNAPNILAGALEHPVYRDWLRAQGDRQIVMIGYSDSTKDGGFLAASWHLQRAQKELHDIAERHSVHLTFFHGRGGSLGRGGGPTARAILSLPTGTFDGSLRLTEQGEILAERYDDPNVAYRHLEQVLWSSVMGVSQRATNIPDRWLQWMDQLSETSYREYRRLIEHPAFVKFFRTVTPVADIEGLRIGSRPSRRTSSDRLEDLRAIPWVFAWTQCRCLVPAWYGLGSALQSILTSSTEAEEAGRMYRDWPFFQATIDNAVLAVAKSNRSVFRRYVDLAGDKTGFKDVRDMIDTEWQRTEDVLRKVTRCNELLDNIPWLQRSIAVRNGYVDPLNLIQAELQDRSRQADAGEHEEDLTKLKQLVLKGLAAGMRTTG